MAHNKSLYYELDSYKQIAKVDMARDIHAPIEHEKDDILDRRYLAERIYACLCGDECPQAVGVYGGWGTGKTSLLNLLLVRNHKPVAGALAALRRVGLP